ncbi:ribonuclease-like [Terrapene carolina triunguis]|uniref:ribonuclease-like n=1 Tax=Terrapene triunguis TaxID=2587831 RepID=UPI000E773862|nr:ribonuclease-like [Terrapene carolina triunguis]
MALRGACPALLLPLVLLVTGLALARGESRYEKFLRQHVDAFDPSPPDARRYCNLLMRRRDMATAHKCKHLNTFIHSSANQIEPVCGDGGEPAGGDLRLSEDPFPLTVCELQGGSDPPDCDYSGSSSTSRIVIACVDGEPVHFETQVESQAGERDQP